MATLKDELASLKIDQAHAPAARGAAAGLSLVAVLLLAGAAGGWFWSQGAQAATVKTAVVTAATGSGSTPGAVLNASG